VPESGLMPQPSAPEGGGAAQPTSELNKWFKEREESIRNDKEEDSGANIPPPPPEVKRDVPPAGEVAARTLAPPAAPQSVLAINGPRAEVGGEPATPNPPISAKKLWIASAIFVAAAGLFHSAQSVSPEWPVVLVWPFVRGSLGWAAAKTRRGVTRVGSLVRSPQRMRRG